MAYYIVKIALSAILIVLITEISQRSTLMGAILASIPLISVIAFIWMAIENKGNEKIAQLSTSVFWLVIPSLPMFLLLPYLLRIGWSFWMALTSALLVTILLYFGMIRILKNFGVEL